MPRLSGMREKHHQPFYDSLIRVAADTAPTPTVAASTRLFATGTNLGQQEWTNMVNAGQFGSDESFVTLAIRCFLWFIGSSALTLYQLCVNQLYLSFVTGPKVQFTSPCWIFPQGGGIWGLDSSTPTATNGLPSNEAILKLGKSVPIPPRQNFYVQADLIDLGSTSLRTNYLNSSTSIASREIKVFLDGLHTRDVL